MPPGMEDSIPLSSSSQPAEPPTASSSTPRTESKPAPKAEPKAASEPEPMDVDPKEADQKKQAEDLKQKGNVEYKARRFEQAIELYNQAWELYPKDITFLTNLSGERSQPRQKPR